MPPFETSSIGANGEPIRIADYVILPAVDPATCGPLHIGVLAHETGHALGLPDLYDYDGSSQGIGAWGLMGTGSHSRSTRRRTWRVGEGAARLGEGLVAGEADSTIRCAGAAQPHGLPVRRRRQRVPAAREPAADRLRPVPAGQRPAHLARRPGARRAGRVEHDDERRPRSGLIEADGRDDLARGLRADAGDPFPGRERDWFRTPHGGGCS
jgi:immune inhibitor A